MSSVGRQHFTEQGPAPDLHWAEGDAVRAKQAEMLDTDRAAMVTWLEIMEELVARDLSDAEFTIQRMRELKAWEKARKRAQARLHYKYDPKRRRAALIARDAQEQLRKKLGEKAEQLNAIVRSRQPLAEPVAEHRPDPAEPPAANPTKFPRATDALPYEAIIAIRAVIEQYPNASDERLDGAFRLHGVRDARARAALVRAARELEAAGGQG